MAAPADPPGQAQLTERRRLLEWSRRRFHQWFRKVWDARGGGLYAVGFAITFLYLELTELIVDDIPTLLTLDSWSLGTLLSFVIDFLIDTLMNTIAAFIWPAHVVEFWPPVGLIGLIVAFVVFPKYLKPHIERWLFKENDSAG